MAAAFRESNSGEPGPSKSEARRDPIVGVVGVDGISVVGAIEGIEATRGENEGKYS